VPEGSSVLAARAGGAYSRRTRRNLERYITGEKGGRGLGLQRSNRAANVRRQVTRSGLRVRNGAEDVPSEGCTEHRIIAGEAGFIGEDAAVEGSRHALDVLADAEIPDPHLAQRAVEISEHSVEKALAKQARLRPIRLEAMKINKRVEANQFKAPVERVRYAIVREENRLAGLLDDPPVSDVCSLAGRIVSAERKHRNRSLTPRPLTTNHSRL
jgi:hypothetical protein